MKESFFVVNGVRHTIKPDLEVAQQKIENPLIEKVEKDLRCYKLLKKFHLI